MPHSKSGKLVSVGDRVVLYGTVTAVQTGEEYCNLTMVADDPMPPYTSSYSITLNTKQVELAEVELAEVESRDPTEPKK